MSLDPASSRGKKTRAPVKEVKRKHVSRKAIGSASKSLRGKKTGTAMKREKREPVSRKAPGTASKSLRGKKKTGTAMKRSREKRVPVPQKKKRPKKKRSTAPKKKKALEFPTVYGMIREFPDLPNLKPERAPGDWPIVYGMHGVKSMTRVATKLLSEIELAKQLAFRVFYIGDKFPGDTKKFYAAEAAKRKQLDAANAFYQHNKDHFTTLCFTGTKLKEKFVLMCKTKTADSVCCYVNSDGIKEDRLVEALPDETKEELKEQWDGEWLSVNSFIDMDWRWRFVRWLEEWFRLHHIDYTAAYNELLRWEYKRLYRKPFTKFSNFRKFSQSVCLSKYFRDMDMTFYCGRLMRYDNPRFPIIPISKAKWNEEYLTDSDRNDIANRKRDITETKQRLFAQWDSVLSRSSPEFMKRELEIYWDKIKANHDKIRDIIGGSVKPVKIRDIIDAHSAHSEYENYLFMDQFPENNDRGDEDLYQQNDVWHIDANERVLPPFMPHNHLRAPSKPSTSGFDVVSVIFAMAMVFVAGMLICSICWLCTALTGYFVASVAKTKATKRDEDDEESQYAVH